MRTQACREQSCDMYLVCMKPEVWGALPRRMSDADAEILLLPIRKALVTPIRDQMRAGNDAAVDAFMNVFRVLTGRPPL